VNVPAFKRLKQDNRRVQDLQSNTGATLKALGSSPVSGSQIATYTASKDVPAGTPVTIAHGLGQSPNGIIPHMSSQSGSWTQSSTIPPDPSIYMSLQFSEPIKAGQSFSFLVF
jgi:hypothetical protein